MELQIKEFEAPAIEFNYEQLKAEVAESVKYYETLVYTDENIAEAKADRARLRKVVEVIDARRKEIKSEIMRPYNEFEAKLNEVKLLLNAPIVLIDNQVKEYEEAQRQAKFNNIVDLWNGKDVSEELRLDVFFNPKWLNVTYSLKKIEEDMDNTINKFKADMGVLERIGSDYLFEGKEVYLSTLDLGKALAEMDRLAEQARRKEEARERAHIIVEERSKFIETPLHTSETVSEFSEEDKRHWVSFDAFINSVEAQLLKKFFNDNDIDFRKKG